MQTSVPWISRLDRPLRLGVLISGGGTTLTNFVEKIAAGALNAQVEIVIASRANCAGVSRAKQAGLKTVVIPRRDFADSGEYSTVIFEALRNADVDLVALAGFLSLLVIPPDFQYRVVNIHPALLPLFGGKGFYGHKVHQAVLESEMKESGCTVHFADNIYDHGPIILQRRVPVLSGDTADTLAARVFAAECDAYPEAINVLAAGRARIEKGQVRLLNAETA